jgi:hypothetical protein
MRTTNPYRNFKPPVPKSHGTGFVGIFWVTEDGTVIPLSCPVDLGRNDGCDICMHGVTHQTSFKDGLKKLAAFPLLVEPLLKMNYDDLERGRVIYKLKDSVYEVTLSSNVKDDPLVQENIMTQFHLAKENTVFKVADRYARRSLNANS